MNWLKFIWKILEEKIGLSKNIIIVIFIIIFIFIAFGSGVYITIKLGLANIVVNISDKGVEPEPEKTFENKCISGNFKDNINSWRIDYYSGPDSEGFYCPRSRIIPIPRMWYKESISTKFESVEIRYKLKDENNNTSTVPLFVFVIGKEDKDLESDKNDILRFHVPEVESHLVGFQKRIMESFDWTIKRLPKKEELDDPVKYGEEVELKVSPRGNIDDVFSFDFKLMYTSAESGKGVEDIITFNDILMSDPNVDSEFSEIRVGIGTERGYCIKPISFKFCY